VKTIRIPEWYGQICPVDTYERKPRRNSGAFARKTLAAIAESLARELSGNERLESWITAVEPRAKILGILALIMCATFLRDVKSLAGLMVVAISIALSASIAPVRLARAWLAVPLFSLAIALPAVLNVFTPGTSVLLIWRPEPGAHLLSWQLPAYLAITREGLIVALRFLLRSTDCVLLALTLVATTEPARLVGGFRRLGMPKVFGMVLEVMQRYLSILLRAAEEIHLAKLSRSVESVSLRGEQSWVAAGMGILFRRAHALSEKVHLAMISRGFDGDVQVAPSPGFKKLDLLWVCATVAVSLALVIADRFL